MRIDSPSLSGSITQGQESYSQLSGSFTGSILGVDSSFYGLEVIGQATINNGSDSALIVSGNISLSGSLELSSNQDILIDGTGILDTAVALAIALG